jgi:hypothetical protein
MTVQALAWAIEQPVPGESKLVLMALANHADHTTGQCHLDPVTIAREASLPETSLPRYLGALRRNGYLARDEKGKERHYWLQFERDLALEWSWKASEHDGDDDQPEAPASAAPASPSIAPSTFQPARQTELREKISPPATDVAADKRFPVIEGSPAYHAWVKHEKDHGRIAPFVHQIIADGKLRRGFMRPSLFPPAGADRNSEVAS